jgi:hypothetical protein
MKSINFTINTTRSESFFFHNTSISIARSQYSDIDLKSEKWKENNYHAKTKYKLVDFP